MLIGGLARLAGSYNPMIKEERDYGNIRLENHNWSNAIITKARQDSYYKQYRAELLLLGRRL